MENVLVRHAHVTMDGVANFVIQNCVMPDVMSTVNARMELASVLLVGTENIALSKDVQLVAQIMDNAVLVAKDYGNVDAMMAGMEPTVRLHWNKIVLIIKTMTKVNIAFSRKIQNHSIIPTHFNPLYHLCSTIRKHKLTHSLRK